MRYGAYLESATFLAVHFPELVQPAQQMLFASLSHNRFLKRDGVELHRNSVCLLRNHRALYDVSSLSLLFCPRAPSSSASAKRDASQPHFDIYQGSNAQAFIISDPSASLQPPCLEDSYEHASYCLLLQLSDSYTSDWIPSSSNQPTW